MCWHYGIPMVPSVLMVHWKVLLFFFFNPDRSSTKCPLRVHIAGHGSVAGPTLGMGLV